MDLNAVLGRAVELGASDIHLKTGQPPVLRRDGELGLLPDHAPRYDSDAGQWHVGVGDHRVMVGRAADDLVLAAEVQLAERRFGN